MKKNSLLLLAVLALLAMTTSCERTCRCQHYNGTIVEYSEAEIEEMGQVCTQMSGYSYNYGLTYSSCEWAY